MTPLLQAKGESLRENYGWGVEEAAEKVEVTLNGLWAGRITYHAEHFQPCMVLIRKKLGVPSFGGVGDSMAEQVKHGVRALLQPEPGMAVDLAGLPGLKAWDLTRPPLKAHDALAVANMLEAGSSTLTSIK